MHLYPKPYFYQEFLRMHKFFAPGAPRHVPHDTCIFLLLSCLVKCSSSSGEHLYEKESYLLAYSTNKIWTSSLQTQHAFLKSSASVRRTAMAVVVLLLSYGTAYAETLTIAHYPYYTFVDRDRMYTVGSLFYAIYFFVSFPMFFRMDEVSMTDGCPNSSLLEADNFPVPSHILTQQDLKKRKWTATDAALDGLAAAMLVTILLDLWRISLGSILGNSVEALGSQSGGLPWM